MPSQKFTFSTSKTIMVLGTLVIFFTLLSTTRHLQRPNNGDGWRILRSAQLVEKHEYYKNQPFPRFFEFKALGNVRPVDLVPMSSSAAIVEMISLAERAAFFKNFDFLWVTAFYLAIYLFGALLLLLNTRFALLIPLLFILANPYILAYFNSPYEESLIIALCPLLSFLFIKTTQSNQFAIRTIALITASAKVQFVPAFLFGIKGLQLKKNIAYLFLAFMLIGAISLKASKFNEPNSYNRYFNGLAYSMAKVSSWPENNFIARRTIAAHLKAENDIAFPIEASTVKPYWGSSFWPTGNRLSSSESKFISDNVGKWFWQTLRLNPHYYYRILTEPIFTMAKADYRMNYIFSTDMSNRWFDISALIMQNFGLIFLLASICSLIIAIKNRNTKHFLFTCFTLLYPLLVVYGDGYYEFEKHLFPVLFLGVTFSLALFFAHFPIMRRYEIQSPKVAQYTEGRSAKNTT